MGNTPQSNNVSQQPSFYWHDYETFGLNPGIDRPAQFAGVRTDLDFNLISEPNEWYCRIPRDYLPNPMACLITGITPQITIQKGLFENEFIKNINNAFSHPETCVIGYNNIRFDDEVTRFTLYRNFLEPYQREWKNNCSRWDIIDLVRACYALRPEGMNWPVDDNGIPSFRLELLTKENGLSHDQAHDAMSDVYATIALAKLLKEKQPKLFNYCFNLRKKENVLTQLKVGSGVPLMHVSGMFPAKQGCISYILPIAMHPTNKNSVIVIDLAKNIQNLVSLSIDEIIKYLYSASDNLPDGIIRPAIKLIHINKCPFIAPAKTLSAERAAELNIDLKQCRESLDFVKQHPELTEKLMKVFDTEKTYLKPASVEEMLYSGGFFSYKDKAKISAISEMGMQQLATSTFKFDDPRLSTLLWHYRARNGEQYLSEEEIERWRNHCQSYHLDKQDSYISEIEALYQEYQTNENKCDVLHELVKYISN